MKSFQPRDGPACYVTPAALKQRLAGPSHKVGLAITVSADHSTIEQVKDYVLVLPAP